MAQWGLVMLLAFSMATSVFAQGTELVITKQPDAAYVAVADNGGTATLTFEVQGGENVSYQWYLSSDGTNENGTAIKGATESSYTTDELVANTSFYYYCVATAGEKSVKSNVTMVANTGLPTLYVNTPDGNDIADKEKERWIDGTSLTLKDAGTDNFENVTTEFRGRGNSTWEQPKKPYAIKLNKSQKRAILQMPEHRRWVLIANYLDNSFLKNHMAFYLSKKFELGYTVRGEFVNLVFNGVYRGLYWLGEAIKVDKNRVKIYDGEDGMDDEDDKDFLIEMDTHFDEVAKFYTPIRKMPYMIKNDDYIVEDVLNEKGKKVKDEYGNTVTQVSTVGQARLERFQNKIATLENLLYPDYETNNNCKVNTNNCSAPDESYADIIDVESWAKFWLINEIMDNTELNEPKSAYFTYQNKKEGDVFKAGPVWDFDAGATKALTSVKLDTSIYYNALFKSPKFIKAVKDVWNKYSSTIDFNTEIQTMRSKLATAAKLDSLMWGDHKDYLENAISGFYGNVDFLTQSLANKVQTVKSYVEKLTNLANLDDEYVAVDGEVLTDTLGGVYKISIADGATVTLNGATINGFCEGDKYPWAGITCLGDCNIILKGKNTVKGFCLHPGIYVPEGKTLTISGTGSLDASGGGGAAGIGCSYKNSCGNIVINGGVITAKSDGDAAGIGAGYEGNAGNIVINGGTVNAEGGYVSAGIGAGGGNAGDITISGGTITAKGSYNANGIGGGACGFARNITITGGTITATGGTFASGIGNYFSDRDVPDITISGGTVTATGGDEAPGIGGNGSNNITITDGVTKVTSIKGKDAGYTTNYVGYTLSGGGRIVIGNKKYDESDLEESPFVYPTTEEYAAVQVRRYNSGTRAVIDGAFGGDGVVNITEEEIKVDAVDFNRKFMVGTYSTMVLPFDVNTSNVSGLDAVLFYNGIGTDKDGNDAVRMKVLWATKEWSKANNILDAEGKCCKEYGDEDLSANTPYLVKMKDPEFKVTGGVTLKKTTEAVTKYPQWEWEFRGVWEYKKWEKGDPELGFAYGFAASAPKDSKIKVGDFVKVGEGAWISPFRAYLVSNNIPVQAIRANGNYVMRPSAVRKEQPELMSIIVDDGDGNDDNAEHTTVIGQFNTRTGEIKMNYDHGKFDLKGRRVNGSNNARGAYYGKKVLK